MENINDNSAECTSSNAESTSSTAELYLGELGIISQQAYETQFFGFTPKSFTDGLYNAVVEYIYVGLVSLSKCLKTEFKRSPKSEQDLRTASENIYKNILPDIGKAFDKLEAYVFQNVFGVPQGVLLKEDRLHSEYPSVDQNTTKQLEEEIEILKKKIKAAKHVNACLRQEVANTEPIVSGVRQIIAEQKSLLSTFQTISDTRESLTDLVDQQKVLFDTKLM